MLQGDGVHRGDVRAHLDGAREGENLFGDGAGRDAADRLAGGAAAAAAVVYTDRGISGGMRQGIATATAKPCWLTRTVVGIAVMS